MKYNPKSDLIDEYDKAILDNLDQMKQPMKIEKF